MYLQPHLSCHLTGFARIRVSCGSNRRQLKARGEAIIITLHLGPVPLRSRLGVAVFLQKRPLFCVKHKHETKGKSTKRETTAGEGGVLQEQGDRRGRGHVRLGRAETQHPRDRAAAETGRRSVLAGKGREPQRPKRPLPPAMTKRSAAVGQSSSSGRKTVQ